MGERLSKWGVVSNGQMKWSGDGNKYDERQNIRDLRL